MGPTMILADLVLPSRQNQRWQYSGIDSPEHCLDKSHFQNYPHTVDYEYNSRGFRDYEWPHSLEELRNAVWCVGDSFTVGLGQPLAQTWPQVLQTTVGRRCINVSMDGASNDWICRRALDIASVVKPRNIVVMWSYVHRREFEDLSLDDEHRRVPYSEQSHEQDVYHWIDLVRRIYSTDCPVIQCAIPNFSPIDLQGREPLWQAVKGADWPTCPHNIEEFRNLDSWILDELQNLHRCHELLQQYLRISEYITASLPTTDFLQHGCIYTQQLDWARDRCHFDRLTSQWVVDQILQRMPVLDVARNDLLPGSAH